MTSTATGKSQITLPVEWVKELAGAMLVHRDSHFTAIPDHLLKQEMLTE